MGLRGEETSTIYKEVIVFLIMVSAIILAGGYATRLRPLSLTKPKALLPILGRPLLDYILANVKKAQPTNIYLSLRVMAEKIIERYKNDTSITFIVENEPLGDAGPLKLIAEKYPLDDDVLVIYGDIYSEIDYQSLLEFHRKKGCDVTMVATSVKDPRRYGVLYLNEDDILLDIIEKPNTASSNLINAGIYIFNKKTLNFVRGKSISRDFLPTLLREGQCISVYKYNGIWGDIGMPQDYAKLNLELLVTKYPKGYIAENVKISENVTLLPPFYIGYNSRILNDSYIENSIIGDNNEIGRGTYIKDTVLMNGTKVGDYSFINGSIISDQCNIGKWNYIAPNSILGDGVITSDGVLINQKTIILPFKELGEPVYSSGEIIL